jgi:hypothetical protein
VSLGTGTAPYIQKVEPMLVQSAEPGQFASALDWYFGLDGGYRADISRRAESLGGWFEPEQGRRTFRIAYEQAVDEL